MQHASNDEWNATLEELQVRLAALAEHEPKELERLLAEFNAGLDVLEAMIADARTDS